MPYSSGELSQDLPFPQRCYFKDLKVTPTKRFEINLINSIYSEDKERKREKERFGQNNKTLNTFTFFIC